MREEYFILRVIAGVAKGHKLNTLKGDATRPTMDKVKGAIFNIIAPRIEGAAVLDLFSGSGSLGIEALSRGANSAVFVDKSRKSTDIIKENLVHTKLINKGVVINKDVCEACNILAKDLTKFDIIFMDPPYNKNFVQKTLIFLDNSGILDRDGIIIVEHSKEDELPDVIGSFEGVRYKKYGITIISFYQLKKE